jgi:hypothetical protein
MGAECADSEEYVNENKPDSDYDKIVISLLKASWQHLKKGISF